ncbi:MAG: DUF4340 domain-containing protein [Planctomycetota bacterium]
MSRTWIKALAVLALVQGVFTFLAWRSTFEDKAPAVSLGFKADEVKSLELEMPGKTLAMSREGGAWVLPGSSGYPARIQKVKEILTKLESLELGQPVARERTSHKRLKVADELYERKIRWGGGPGLIVGTSPSYNVIHVRLEGQDAVYQVEGLSAWDLGCEVRDWVNPEILALPLPDLRAFSIKSPAGECEFTKGAEGPWAAVTPSPNGEPLDVPSLNSIVGSVSYLSLEQVLSHVSADASAGWDSQLKARGLEPAAMVLTLTSETSREVPLTAEEIKAQTTVSADGTEVPPVKKARSVHDRKVDVLRIGDEKDGLVAVTVEGRQTIYGVRREALARVLGFRPESLFKKTAPAPEK